MHTNRPDARSHVSSLYTQTCTMPGIFAFTSRKSCHLPDCALHALQSLPNTAFPAHLFSSHCACALPTQSAAFACRACSFRDRQHPPLALPNPAQPCACICCMACKNPFQNPNRQAAAARCRSNFEMNTFKPCPILKGQTKPVQAPIAVNRTAFCPIPPAPAPALWPAAPQCARLRPADRSSPAEWHAPPPRQ